MVNGKDRQYKNPDGRCTYPYDRGPLGYCWGYATYVDGDAGCDLESLCSGCDLFKDEEEKKGD